LGIYRMSGMTSQPAEETLLTLNETKKKKKKTTKFKLPP